MPYANFTHRGVYVTNGSGGTLNHGQPVKEANFVGVAVKQKAQPWTSAHVTTLTIASTEAYYLVTKGEVQVANTGITGAVKGDPIYITSANALSTTATANFQFGRVTEVAGANGVPTGKVRIDLNAKSAVAAAAF